MGEEDNIADDSGEGVTVTFLDMFIISALFGLVIYWFFFKGKKKEQPQQLKKLSIAPNLGRSESFDPSFINKMKKTGKNVIVFYGSQTGTAEEFAGRLSKDSQRYGMKGMAADPEECEMEDLPRLREIENSLAIFCLSTYGEGDPTDNAQEFYEWLKGVDSTELDGLRYTVFGLGNKTYEHYNSMGKFVDQRMEELGGKRIFELGLGDDDGNLEEDFVTWKEKFWPAVCELFGVEATGDEGSIRQYELTIHSQAAGDMKIFTGEVARIRSYVNQRPPYDAKNPFMGPVLVNRELHKGGERSCMHIEIGISSSKIRYESGDHMAVYPTNDPTIVQALADLLNFDPETLFTLTNVDEEASKKHPFPCPCSYRTALLHYLDITSPPRTNVLKDLADYAADEKEKQFLLNLSSSTPEGKKEYHDWIVGDHRNILAVLEDLPSVKPPIDHLCELLPRLQARYYSISSSPKMYPESIHITAVVVEYQTRAKRVARGVATNWLRTKVPVNGFETKVPVYVRKSQFKLPFKHTGPIIMVGPGTGFAPFRGFIQERSMAKKEGKEIGETILYFGCRKQSQDYLYEEELQRYLEEGALSKLYVAFSRDQQKKVYVQHLLRENSAETWRILENNGHIYVCGDARNMAREVHEALRETISREGNLDSERAEAYIKKLQQKGRYSTDVWS